MAQLFSQYKQMFDKMSVGAFFQGADGTLVDVNPAALEMFGLSLEQFMGRTSYHHEWRVIDEHGQPLAPEQHPSMLALRSGKKVSNFVAGVYNPLKHDFIWLNISALPMFRSGESTPYQVCVTFNDITSRILAERQLEENSERFRSIMELSPDIISVIDSSGHLLYNSPAALQIHGYTQEDLTDRNTLELIHPDDLNKVSDAFQEVICSPGLTVSVKYRYRNKDGSYQRMECRAVNHLATPYIQGIIAISRDISKLEDTLDLLNASEEKFAKAFNNSPALMAITTIEDGRYLEVNDQFCKTTGLNREEVIGRTSIELGWMTASARQRMKELLQRDGQVNDLEIELTKPDGTTFCCLFSASPVTIGSDLRLLSIAIDVTERRKTELALKTSEELYRAIVNSQTEFIDRFLPGGILTFVNEALCRYWKVRPSDLIGKSFYPFLHEDDLQALLAELAALTPEKPSVDFENRVNYHDGTVHWHSWTHHAIFAQDGAVIEYQSVGRDITRRKLAELERNNYEEKLNLALNAAMAGLWDRDFVTGKITWSRETFLLYGLDPAQDEASMATWQRVLHPDDLAMIRGSIKEAVTGHNDLYVDHRVIWPDGSNHWLKAIGKPSYDNEGRPLRISGIVIDITERKVQEVALRQSEEMSRAILSSTNDLILFIDPDGMILLANEAVAERFGKTVDAFVGTNIFHYFPEDVRRIRREKLAKAVQTRSPVRYEDDRDGRYFDNCLFPVVGAGNTVTGVAVFSRDITERKHYADALKNANEDLEMRVDERTASLAKANEQIRQMSFILLKAEEQERMRIAAELHDQVGQTLLLAKMKVDALASEAGAAGSSTDISSLLEQCLQDIRTLTFTIRPPLLETAGIEAALEWLCKSIYENYQLQVDYSSDCRSIHLNNEQRYSFYMAVRELLLNVAKHAGVDNAGLSLKTEGSDLVVQVRDTGSGFETETGTCLPAGGPGFGLFNVAQRISLLGGRCHIDSQPGKGTVVTLTIPMGA